MNYYFNRKIDYYLCLVLIIVGLWLLPNFLVWVKRCLIVFRSFDFLIFWIYWIYSFFNSVKGRWANLPFLCLSSNNRISKSDTSFSLSKRAFFCSRILASILFTFFEL
uniref:Uncharacterized protein n=1 Tax=Schizopora paradoxa TaxID=27342 RepID=A0A5B9RB71_9AGAM|nr:hypothetical protein Schpa_000066 [Schizopora paradoxa]QEG57226.1 hypothetical protein Schpa_000066 [Schizopora paradoxa]